MNKKLFLGDDAIAQGALDAGLSGVYSYPGTPSTEITEYIQNATKGSIPCRWSTNEKTAMETALGMSYAGKRALVCMKHVGMNVAADAFVNSALTGANGGLMVVAADDPSMHSSQNEQDSRFYGKFAFTLIFEPSSQQECYDMTRYAYDFSEKMGSPVLMRVTTRLAHSRSAVNTQPVREQNPMQTPEKTAQWLLMPGNSRRRYNELLAQWPDFIKASQESPYNKYTDGKDKTMGIIACGIGYNYLMENCQSGCQYPVLKISQYPLPVSLVERMIRECERVMVIEEGQPMVEEQIKGMLDCSGKIIGRLSGHLPRVGELNPDSVRAALGMTKLETFPAASAVVMPRPPALCAGCGHRDVYNALNEVLADYPGNKVFSDIGCYTLGSLPPFRAIDTVVDMGASITMARGAAEAGLYPAVSVIGDSTFTHSGMTGLLDAVNTNANVTIIISDNLTTAMTGGQDSAGTNRLESICLGLGVAPEHVRGFVPIGKNMEQMKQIIKEEIEYKGVSVIIPRRECLQTLKRHLKDAKKQ